MLFKNLLSNQVQTGTVYVNDDVICVFIACWYGWRWFLIPSRNPRGKRFFFFQKGVLNIKCINVDVAFVYFHFDSFLSLVLHLIIFSAVFLWYSHLYCVTSSNFILWFLLQYINTHINHNAMKHTKLLLLLPVHKYNVLFLLSIHFHSISIPL